MGTDRLRIGAVAEQAGVNVQTLRYYERRGLLARPGRTASGYREYGPDTTQIVQFIKRAQQLGFTLSEVQELLTLRATPNRDRARVRRVATAKIADIEEKVARLNAVRRSLVQLVGCCETGETLKCSILEALNGECEVTGALLTGPLPVNRKQGASV